MESLSSIRISDVNELSSEQFILVFGNVVELCTDVAVQVAKKRPFGDVEALCDAFHNYLNDIDKDAKVLVLKLHPDLAGRLAASGELTRESTNEQRTAGLHQLTSDQKKIINDYNDRYKNKFGFPFIICARENKVQSILEGLQKRYNNIRDQEIATAIDEVKKICKFRILDIVTN